MDYLSSDINNPFFAGYAMECDADNAIKNIVRRCGTSIAATTLTEELKKEGLDPMSLTPQAVESIDSTFDCF